MFAEVFLGGVKSGEICFLPLETKKTAFFAEIFQIRAPFRHPCLCVGKTSCQTGAQPAKNSGGQSHFWQRV